MKYQSVFVLVRVMVHTDHERISDTVRELETHSTLLLTDTANINVLETEILVSRYSNPKIYRTSNPKKIVSEADSKA